MPFHVPSSTPVYIALGSNMGASRDILRQTFQRLAFLSTKQPKASSLWETTPVHCPAGSPLFLNAVVCIHATGSPEQLLAQLQSLEKEMGRQPKKILNEPRPLDLDIIAFGTEQRQTPALILPHPRAHTRRFVLQPLSEVEPDLILPGQTKTVRDLLNGLSSDETLRCIDPHWHSQP